MKEESKATKPELLNERIDRLIKFMGVLIDPYFEIFRGFRKNTLPVVECCVIGCVLGFLALKSYDFYLFKKLHLEAIYPKGNWKTAWGLFWTTISFYGWGVVQVGQKIRMLRKLEETFLNCGLQNKIGDFPKYIIDVPIDTNTRRLRLTNAGLPISRFKEVAESIDANLGVFVVKIVTPEQNRQAVDIIYSNTKMPDLWFIEDINQYKNYSFPIGKTYGTNILANLRDVPHILVAGATGGGKSTFIRMVVTILAMNNSKIKISMIDFKGGTEAQVFEGIDGISIFGTLKTALAELERVDKLMNERFELFRNNKVKDLEAYNKLQTKKNLESEYSNNHHLGRQVVVIDEISELVPTVGHPDVKSVLRARNIVNRISRLGRSVGINLLIGTQKPDAKNLDPTIKANLSGIVCFYVIGHTQSIVVLGNKRGSELSADIKGRAIWQFGSIQEEVQTPFLTEMDVQNYFKTDNQSTEDENEKTERRKSSATHGRKNIEVPVALEDRDVDDASSARIVSES